MSMTGVYDPFLVGLSFVIAVAASFAGLSLASRMARASGRARNVWLAMAALALGGGIWSMHFVAMLAFSLPGMSMSYDPWTTFVSFLIPVFLTGLALRIVAPHHRSARTMLPGGLLMGGGVLTMHYLGMAAMQMPASITYDPLWVAGSALIAIAASLVAVWLAFGNHRTTHSLAASVAMGIAIAGMHYTAMKAASFSMPAGFSPIIESAGIDQGSLATTIGLFSVLLLGLAVGAARLDRLLKTYERREARIALRLQIADILREKSTLEALDEIASLMGQHFAVTRAGYGQLDPVDDCFDYDVCWTDGTVPPLLGRYPASDFGEKIVAALKAGKTIVVEDLQTDAISDEHRTRNTARDVDTRSILVVPFVREGRLRTIVYLNDREPRRWNRHDIAFMEELAERTRLVIEREAVEQQLRDLNATLEERVAQRTRELEEAQEALLQSQKMEAVGQLVAGMAHDFNNVLASLVSAFNIISRRPEDIERVKRFSDAGVKAAERGAKLTAQLMAFSRSHKIQLSSMFVCDVIEQMEELLARTLGPMITVKKQLNPTPAPVMADATQVEMMILNLAINARDAMPEGGTLTISTSKHAVKNDPEVAPGDYIEVAVSDTGTGMDADTLRRAMEPFFTTKPIGKGTGLGLAQIYGSARQAGGTVRIESVLGQGTTVRVFLPCTDQSADSGNGEICEQGDHGEMQSVHVLLVDDDEDLRSVLTAGLEDLGHTVSAASSGPAALAILETEKPQLAVLDFAMPGMHGAALAEQLRNRIPNLPIIFVTGYADTAAIKGTVGEEALILQKPFELQHLALAMKSACLRPMAPVLAR